MFCTNCGSQNTPESRFCVRCGTSLTSGEAQAPSSTQSANASESSRREWICPKCGEVVEEPLDICWNCGTERATAPLRDALFAAEPVASANIDRNTVLAASPTIRSDRYPTLRLIAVFYRLLAALAGLGTAYLAINTAGNHFLGAMQGPTLIGMLIAGIFVVISLLALAESVQLFLNIEENTRRTADLLRKRKK